MSIVYLDTETTGLDPNTHEIWDIAYAVDDSQVRQSFVAHHGITADAQALEMNGYEKAQPLYDNDPRDSQKFERRLMQALHDNTLCCANPAFDAAFLKARWSKSPWKYRLFDIEAYAMGALGYVVPQGLKTITTDLRDKGYDIPEPDHTAAADVATLRACHLALIEEYSA